MALIKIFAPSAPEVALRYCSRKQGYFLVIFFMPLNQKKKVIVPWRFSCLFLHVVKKISVSFPLNIIFSVELVTKRLNDILCLTAPFTPLPSLKLSNSDLGTYVEKFDLLKTVVLSRRRRYQCGLRAQCRNKFSANKQNSSKKKTNTILI